MARLVKANIGVRTATLDCGDWDMHEDLGAAVAGKRFYDNLSALATALAAFAADLGPDGMRRVTLVTISEFGRRVQENANGGVDNQALYFLVTVGGGIQITALRGEDPFRRDALGDVGAHVHARQQDAVRVGEDGAQVAAMRSRCALTFGKRVGSTLSLSSHPAIDLASSTE